MEAPGPTPDSPATQPYLLAATNLPKLTWEAVLMGIVMAVVLGASRRASTSRE